VDTSTAKPRTYMGMTNISASAESAREASREADGRFGSQAHTSPEISLGTAGAGSSTENARQRAAALFSAAQTEYHRANVAAATEKLRGQFPWAGTAVFTRAWDDPEGAIQLSQLIGADDVLDLEDDPRAANLTRDQIGAADDALRWIGELGPEVSAYLEEGEVSHDGWYEYQLDLTKALDRTRPEASFVDMLDEHGRNLLDAELSERDGRLVSVVDLGEIDYQLTEGFLAEDHPEVTAALVSKYGTARAAAEAIADSDQWFQFREELADEVSERVRTAIHDAGAKLLAE